MSSISLGVIKSSLIGHGHGHMTKSFWGRNFWNDWNYSRRLLYTCWPY